MTQFFDGLSNAITGLGDPNRDKLAGTSYAPTANLGRDYWRNFVRSSGLARKVCTKPASDAVREWREWHAESADISKLEKLEKQLGTSDAIKQALEDRAATGRGFVYFDNGEEPSEPINTKTARPLRFVRYIDEASIADGPVDSDPLSDNYGFPEYYEILTNSSGILRIHPSRLMKFYGHRVVGSGVLQCQYDPVIRASHDAILQHDLIRYNVAGLTTEAKSSVFFIAGLSNLLSDANGESAFHKALQTAAYTKSNYSQQYMDAGDDANQNRWEQKQTSFATLPDVIEKAEDYVCAQAGYPRAYLFTRTSGGLGDNGQSELELAYSEIHQIQATVIEPQLAIYDELLIKTALGSRPEELYFEWRSLWSMSDKDRAEIAVKLSDAFKKIRDADLLPADVLAPAVVNTLTEKGGIQGLEQAFNDYYTSSSDDDDLSDDDMLADGIDYIADRHATAQDIKQILSDAGIDFD